MASAISPVAPPLLGAGVTPAPSAPATAMVRSVPTARRGLFAASHLAVQSLLLNAISVPVMAYIVRRLGDVGFGHWSTATTLVASTSVLANLGLRGAFVRSVARDPATAPAALAEQITLRLLLSILAGGIAVACVLPYPPVVRACVAVAAAGLLFTTINNTLADLLQGLHRISVYAGSNLLAGLALTAVSLAAVFWGAGPVGLSVAYLAGPICGAALLAWYVRRRLWTPLPPGDTCGEQGGGDGDIKPRTTLGTRNHPHPNPLPEGEGTRGAPPAPQALSTRHRFGRLLWVSRFFAAQQLVNTLSNNAESLLLPLLVDAGAFGCFSAGLLLASRLIVIPDGLGSAFYPMVATLHATDPRAAARELKRYLLVSLAACLPIAIGLSAVATPIATLLFPHSAAVCTLVIRLTVWSLPLNGIENVMGYSLNAAGQDAA